MAVIRVRLAKDDDSNLMGDQVTLKDRRTAGDENVGTLLEVCQSTKWGNNNIDLTEKQARELYALLRAKFDGVV